MDLTEGYGRGLKLLSASCTTRWTTFVLGELWLVPDGLLRRVDPQHTRAAFSAGWQMGANGLRAALGPSVPTNPLVTRPYDRSAMDDLRGDAKRTLWVPREQIADARLRHGLLASALRLRLIDGSRVKLLWLKRDPASELLPGVLANWLGRPIDH